MQGLRYIFHGRAKGGDSLQREIIKKVKDKKIIAIVRNVYGDDCRKLAQALFDGGIEFMEFTFDQQEAKNWERTCENIAMVRQKFAGKIDCGAGTVLTREQVRMANKAGARFIISPNCSKPVIEETVRLGMVSMPGAMTASEIICASEYGADFVKIFPIADLGANYIKAIRGPISHIPLLAVGGVNEKNIAEFLDAGADGVGVGGDLVNKKWIAAGEFQKITELAKKLVQNSKRG